jgi:hypothetical protein
MKRRDLAPCKSVSVLDVPLGGREVESRLTIPKAIVFALVRGWFFMKRRGTERPIAATTRRM